LRSLRYRHPGGSPGRHNGGSAQLCFAAIRVAVLYLSHVVLCGATMSCQLLLTLPLRMHADVGSAARAALVCCGCLALLRGCGGGLLLMPRVFLLGDWTDDSTMIL
jgi:hypothetical protein